jgi:hypothetical protein
VPRFVIPLVWALPSLLILCSGTALPVAHAAGSVSPPQTLEPSSPADAAVLALAQAMNDPFRRAGVKLRVRRIESVSKASLEPRKEFSKQNTIYIGFDLLQPGRATLYVTTSHDDRIYARDFELPDGLSEVAMEQLVVAARTSVEAALMGIPIGDPRKDFGTQGAS